MKSPDWMVFTPGLMRNRRCENCGREFVKWGLSNIRQPTARFFVHLWHGSLISALVLTLAWYLPELIFRR